MSKVVSFYDQKSFDFVTETVSYSDKSQNMPNSPLCDKKNCGLEASTVTGSKGVSPPQMNWRGKAGVSQRPSNKRKPVYNRQ